MARWFRSYIASLSPRLITFQHVENRMHVDKNVRRRENPALTKSYWVFPRDLNLPTAAEIKSAVYACLL